MRHEDQRLLGKLYSEVLPTGYFDMLNERLKLKERSEDAKAYYMERWLGANYNNRSWSDLIRNDYLSKPNRAPVIERINDEDTCIKSIQNDIDQIAVNKEELVANMIKALESTDGYVDTSFRMGVEAEEVIYNVKAKKRLIDYYKNTLELPGNNISNYIRWYMYFAVHKSVPEDFSANARFKRDLDEFSKDVIQNYGMVSKHAIREIVKLAERKPNPNIIALYEYSDLCYYGNAEGIKQDISKAFERSKQAAGIDYDGQIDRPIDSHPLALWSLADICLKYKRSEEPVYNSGIIYDLEGKDYLDRIKLAYKYANMAFSISKLPAAANTLGKIARYTDSDPECEGIEAFKDKVGMDTDYVEWFKKAAEGGYVYAYNNLATEELRLLINEKDNTQAREEHKEQYLYYLHQSADLAEPWAACKLGRIYLNGITRKVNKKEEEVIDDSTIDIEEAYKWFMKSYQIYHKYFYDAACAWAGAYLLKYYSARLSHEEIEDINSIIDKYSYLEGILDFVHGKKRKTI